MKCSKCNNNIEYLNYYEIKQVFGKYYDGLEGLHTTQQKSIIVKYTCPQCNKTLIAQYVPHKESRFRENEINNSLDESSFSIFP